MEYNLREGDLKTDLDTLYDEEGNKIDVYSSVYWTGESKEDYEAKEKIIEDFKVENDLVEIFAWCDVSGYNYWVLQQEEFNYVSIDVVLKKSPEEYTQEEIQQIRDMIIEADDYFTSKLM